MKKLVAIGKQFSQRIEETDVFGLAAQLAYFLLLSLFPFLLFLLTLVGYLPINQDMVMELIASLAPQQMVDIINDNIYQLLNRQDGGLLSFGIIGTLWAASNGINALTRAFNKANSIEKDRTFLLGRLISIVLTVAMVAVIVIAFLLPIYGRMIGVYILTFFGLSDDFLAVWDTMRWVVSSVIVFIVLLALYTLAPNIRLKIRNVVWGALFSTVFWQLTSLGFSYYVNTIGNYDTMYGSLGAVIVMMIWFYISGIIIITGGVLNAFIRDTKKRHFN